MREIADMVQAWEARRSEPFALATLVRAHGSSYRRPGARMLVDRDGVCTGSLSGGCLEEEVAAQAQEVLRTSEPAWMEFDTRRRFGCYGAIEIFVERVETECLAALAEAQRMRRSILLCTRFGKTETSPGTGVAQRAMTESAESLVQVIEPALQLLVVGEGPDSTALHSFARTLGWSTVLVEGAAELAPTYDAWTAAVVKTHNYGRDFAALRALLPLGLRYVGLLGPRRRREQLLGDLLDTGVFPGENLFGPAGLDLGSDAPEAIALAIVAEIQSVFHWGTGEPLRRRAAPIHAVRAAVRLEAF